MVGKIFREGQLVTILIYGKPIGFRIKSAEFPKQSNLSAKSPPSSPSHSSSTSASASPSVANSATFGVFKVSAKTVIDILAPKKDAEEELDEGDEDRMEEMEGEQDEQTEVEGEDKESVMATPKKKGREQKEGAMERIGGLEAEIQIVRQMIALPLTSPHIFETLGLAPPRGLLLYGPPGCGKTLIARSIAAELDASIFVINGPEVLSKFYGESEAKLRAIFEEAAKNAPSLIFIDEIDALAPRRDDDTQQAASKRVVGTLLTLLDGMESMSRVVVLAATNRPNALDPALRRAGRFDREVEIGIPKEASRRKILEVHLAKMPHTLTAAEIDKLAADTHGYVGADLKQLCQHAAMRALTAHKSDDLEAIKVTNEDFFAAMREVRPSAMREVVADTTHTTWSDIGGYDNVKQRLIEAVQWPLQHKEKFTRFGLEAPRGVLLYGPPGCCKTLCAKALASESGLPFIAVRGSELFSKYVGDSEKAVAEVFRKARAASPSVVFIDEIDALAVARGAGEGNSVQDRVLSQILTELDGVSAMHNVLFLAATNRPELLDSALMRPGRLDRIIYIPPPDLDARKEIFRIHTRKMPISPDIDWELLYSKTDSYTGAEIAQVCREAALHALRVSLSAEQVTMNDFLAALKAVPPRLDKDSIAFYENYAKTTGLRITE